MSLRWTTTRRLPSLCNYAEAEAYEAKIIPIRGDADGTKPLGRRDQKYRWIKRYDDGVIAVGQGNYHAITYYPDGLINIDAPRWGQKSTEGDIVGNVLGWRWRSHDGKFWIKDTKGWHPLRPQPNGRTYNTPRAEQELKLNLFRACESKGWPRTPEALYPVLPVTHIVNRAGKREVMSRYAAFLHYADAMAKLRESLRFDNVELVRVFGGIEGAVDYQSRSVPYPDMPDMPDTPSSWRFNKASAVSLCEWMRSDDPEQQYKALALFCARTRLDRDGLMASINDVIAMAHFDEVLTKKVHEHGKITRDRYAPLVHRCQRP